MYAQIVTNEPKVEVDASKPPRGVFKRLTSKLRNLSQSGISDVVVPSTSHSSDSSNAIEISREQPTQDAPTSSPPESHPADKMKRKSTRKLLSLPSLPHASKAHPLSTSGMYASLHHEMENDWSSPAKREAALRASGLVPAKPKPGRDLNGYRLPLSELETQMDDKYAIMVEVPDGDSSPEKESEDSEAKRIREEWLKHNMNNEEGRGKGDEVLQKPEAMFTEEPYSEPDDAEGRATEELTTRNKHVKGRTSSVDSANDLFHDALESQGEDAQDQKPLLGSDVSSR